MKDKTPEELKREFANRYAHPIFTSEEYNEQCLSDLNALLDKLKQAEIDAKKNYWAEKSKQFDEILDKYFAEHTREEIMADLGIKEKFSLKLKRWFRSRMKGESK